ncbi:hypothetical protein KAT51_07210 [bacterium]|nr:hypothetical protein [bacterium]
MDIENAINKARWELWRTEQRTEREKTYFYCWNNWSDVPWTCASDHACIPEGLCILCANTLHEAECESYQKGIFLAYSYGNIPIPLCSGGTGGNCWAAAIFTSKPMYLPSKFKIRASVELNGRCVTSAGVVADLAIFIEVDSLGISDKVYYVNAAEIPGGKKEWNNENLDLWTPEHTTSPSNHEIKVRFRGQGTCCGEETYAAAEFNDRYGDGFYVKLRDIYVLEV